MIHATANIKLLLLLDPGCQVSLNDSYFSPETSSTGFNSCNTDVCVFFVFMILHVYEANLYESYVFMKKKRCSLV